MKAEWPFSKIVHYPRRPATTNGFDPTLLKSAQSPREAAILWLLGGAGLRVSEVAALKAEHVDGHGGYLHVVNGKGGKHRTSILPKPALEALQSQLNGHDMVMSSREEIPVISPRGRSRDR